MVLAGRAALAPGLPGQGVVAALPAPPAVGSCLLLPSADAVVEVPCDQPHAAEVVAGWPAGTDPVALDLPDTDGQLLPRTPRSLVTNAEDVRCRGWIEAYTGWPEFVASYQDQLWVPPQPLIAGRLITAPPGEALPDRHWSACIATTALPLYDGVLRNAAFAFDGRPDAVSICVSPTEVAAQFVPCVQPHTVELLATAALTTTMMVENTIEIDLTAEQVYAQCVALVRTVTGNADPTYQGELQIVNESVWVQRDRPVVVTAPGWIVPDCLVKLRGEGVLVGSVVGVGDNPLPVRQ